MLRRAFERSSLLALFAALLALAQNGPVDFELRTFPDSPVVFAAPLTQAAPGAPHRQFVTVRNDSRKSAMALLFEQSVPAGGKTSIVAMERVPIVFASRETRRVSVSVEEILRKLSSGELLGRPVLSLVAVEFLDGSQWSAPTGPAPR